MTDHKTSVEHQAFLLASQNKFDELKQLFTTVQKPAVLFLTMAIMGGAESRNDQIVTWAWDNGGCILFKFQQEKKWVYENTRDTNRELRMLGGKGEVSQGMFKSE
jgi:hypothetical protein